MQIRTKLVALSAISALLSCAGDTIPEAPVGAAGGAVQVVFNVQAHPLPEVPLPNDVATFPDPTSRTGRRIQASVNADTAMERRAREAFAGIEGWGTFAPISVSFNYPGREGSLNAAIDLGELRARMGRDYDFENDAVYIIELKSGVPAAVDVGQGNYPMALTDLDDYGANDPHAQSDTLLFEDREEAAGLSQSAYTPSLDTDFDGVLDHPNVFAAGPLKDQLMTWYERETDTLILRPLIPLKESTEYAVVITDRLKAFDGNSVSSPFAGVAHAAQTAQARRVGAILSDSAHANYYGDLAGTGLSRVSFLWSFTTQPVHDDLLALRNGLYGQGPYARFASEYTASMKALPAVGAAVEGDGPAGWEQRAECKRQLVTPYIVRMSDPDVKSVFRQMYKSVFDYDDSEVVGLEEAVTNIDYVVIGTYRSPFLRGGPNEHNPDSIFDMRASTGEAKYTEDTVSFWLSVPKQTAEHKAPFPVVMWGHGAGGQATESVQHGGNYARQGVATLTINMPLHGLPDWKDIRATITAALTSKCLAPWTNAVLTGRVRDENGDGDADPAHWWWTAHVANVRDNVRQGALDQMQMTRILKSFDGRAKSGQDFNADGVEDLAGDFNGDGIVDVGGPNTPLYAAGGSLGGIMADIVGAIDPAIVASAPMAGGGGLSDIGMRSYGVAEAMFQLISPIITSEPADVFYPQSGNDKPSTSCAKGQRSVRFVGVDGPSRIDAELACLSAAENAEGMTVVVRNRTARTAHCATAGKDGRFRVGMGASRGDRFEVSFYKEAHAVDSYKSCNVHAYATELRTLRTFEVKAAKYKKIADESGACPESAADGCAQYMGTMYPVGSALVAPQEGFGFHRNAPQLRRFFALAQVALEPADPVNFAAHYMLSPFALPDGSPGPAKSVLHINTVGDGFVSASSGVSFARASGAVPFLAPNKLGVYAEYNNYVTPPVLYTQLGNRTPNDVLIQTHTVEGQARFKRHPSTGPNLPNYRIGALPLCSKNPVHDAEAGDRALFDVDNFAEGAQPFHAQILPTALRLARRNDVQVTDAASLTRAWEPRLKGAPGGSDVGAWDASAPLVGFANVYISPDGKHTWNVPDTCKVWDDPTFGGSTSARFLSTQGRDLYYLSHPKTFGCITTNSCTFPKLP